MGIPRWFEMKELISLDISEGFKDPIDLKLIKHEGLSFLLKYIGVSSNNRTITYCSGLFVNFDTSREQFSRNNFFSWISIEVETLNKGIKLEVYLILIN